MFLYFFALYTIKLDSKINVFLINMYTVAIWLSWLFGFLGPIHRFQIYFIIFSIIILPLTIYSLDKKSIYLFVGYKFDDKKDVLRILWS